MLSHMSSSFELLTGTLFFTARSQCPICCFTEGPKFSWGPTDPHESSLTPSTWMMHSLLSFWKMVHGGDVLHLFSVLDKMFMDALQRHYYAKWQGLETFENVESNFQITRCIRQRSVEAPPLWLKNAMQILWKVEKEWTKKKDGNSKRHVSMVNIIKSAASCGQTTSEFYHTQRRTWSRGLKTWSRRQKDGTWNQNQQVCGGQTHVQTRNWRTWWSRQKNMVAQISAREKLQEHKVHLQSRSENAKTAWRNECKVRTKAGGETRRFTDARTFHGDNCTKMVDHVCSVFCFGSENWFWSRETLDRIKGWETTTMRRLFRFKRKEDETLTGYCTKTARASRTIWKKDEASIVWYACRKHVESHGKDLWRKSQMRCWRHWNTSVHGEVRRAGKIQKQGTWQLFPTITQDGSTTGLAQSRLCVRQDYQWAPFDEIKSTRWRLGTFRRHSTSGGRGKLPVIWDWSTISTSSGSTTRRRITWSVKGRGKSQLKEWRTQTTGKQYVVFGMVAKTRIAGVGVAVWSKHFPEISESQSTKLQYRWKRALPWPGKLQEVACWREFSTCYLSKKLN